MSVDVIIDADRIIGMYKCKDRLYLIARLSALAHTLNQRDYNNIGQPKGPSKY